MTNRTQLSRTRARAIVMMASTIAIAVALTACRGAQPGTAKSSPSAKPTSAAAPAIVAPISTEASVIGKLDVLIAMTTMDSVPPDPPPSYALLVHSTGDNVSTQFPVDADGTFALALPAGRHEVEYVQLETAALGAEPVLLPLTNGQRLHLRAPATGCAYGGEVHVVYGRLPAGTQKQQETLVERASTKNGENYSFVYRPDGGFMMAGASVSLAAQGQRPAAARTCGTDTFTLTAT